MEKKYHDIEAELLGTEGLWREISESDSAFLKSQNLPVEKWKDILFNADRDLVKRELERLLDILALQEEVISANSLEQDFQLLESDVSLRKKLQNHKNNFAIESMGKILSNE